MRRVERSSRCLVVLGVLLLLPSVPGIYAEPFPSNENLESRNVALRLRKLVFTSGMQQAADGKYSCNGLEIFQGEGGGSGFIVREDGTIVTNWHVAEKTVLMEAEFADKSRFEVNNIRVGVPELDIAILKINSQKRFTPVALGDSEKVSPRDKVLAVGNTLLMGLNITEGQVSQVVRSEEGRATVIRHTAQIAPGNSGGALYKGKKVIGVNASVNVALGGISGFNNAIPINLAKPFLDDPRYMNRLLPLRDVFNPSPDRLTKNLVPVLSTNGQVAGATAKGPGIAMEVLQTGSLEDYMIVVQSPGKDLGILAVARGSQNSLIGCGDVPAADAEALLLSSKYPQEVGIAIVNKDSSPANFGLFIGKINW